MWAQALLPARGAADPGRAVASVAGSLLTAVETFLDGRAVITVSTGEADVPAIRLYERHGYAIVKRRTLPDRLRMVALEKRSDR